MYLCRTWESYWECTVVAFVAEATTFGFGKNRVWYLWQKWNFKNAKKMRSQHPPSNQLWIICCIRPQPDTRIHRINMKIISLHILFRGTWFTMFHHSNMFFMFFPWFWFSMFHHVSPSSWWKSGKIGICDRRSHPWWFPHRQHRQLPENPIPVGIATAQFTTWAAWCGSLGVTCFGKPMETN